MPGHYQVKLTVAGKAYISPLELKLDPRIKTPEADLQKQFDLAMKIRQRVNEAHDAVNQMRDLRSQLHALRARLANDLKAKPVLDAAEALDKKMAPVEDEIIQSKIKSSEDSLNYPLKLDAKYIALASIVESADTAPTQQSYDLLDTLNPLLEVQLARWKEIVGKDVAAFDDLLRKKNVPVIFAPPSQPESAPGK
jgi:hypothetical protein